MNDMEPTVEELCDKLQANDAGFKFLVWPYCDGPMTNEQLGALCEALRQNKTVKHIEFYASSDFSSYTCVPLAAVLREHPTVKELEFIDEGAFEDFGTHDAFEDFGTLVQAAIQNESLSHVCFSCHFTPIIIEGLGLLLDSNSLESLELQFCNAQREQQGIRDLAASLQRNKSLRKLVYKTFRGDEDNVIQALSEIPALLRSNQGLQDLELSIVGGTNEFCSNVFKHVLEAAVNNESLKRIQLEDDNTDYCQYVNGEQIGRALANILHSTSCLTALDLDVHMYEDITIGLAEGLAQNATLPKLVLGSKTITGSIGSIGNALQSNTTMQTLDIKTTANDVDGVESIARMLTVNSTLKDVRLWYLDNDSLQSFSELLPRMSGLKNFSFSTLGRNGFKQETWTAFQHAMEHNTALQGLTFHSFRSDAEGVASIARMLTVNSTLKKIDLKSLDNRCLQSFSEFLPRMNGLKHFTFLPLLRRGRSTITPETATTFLHALTQNKSLVEVDGIKYMVTSPVAFALMILVLVRNSTLEKVELTHRVLGDGAVKLFARHLPRMRSLKYFTFSCTCTSTEETEGAFLNGMERNANLIQVNANGFSDDAKSKVKRLTDLNRGGRRILGTEAAEQRSLWPYILARSSKKPDVLNFFLREKPDVLVSQSEHRSTTVRSRKRKRDDD